MKTYIINDQETAEKAARWLIVCGDTFSVEYRISNTWTFKVILMEGFTEYFAKQFNAELVA